MFLICAGITLYLTYATSNLSRCLLGNKVDCDSAEKAEAYIADEFSEKNGEQSGRQLNLPPFQVWL